MGRKKAQAAVKIGYFDLETSNLNADLGVLLCAALAINDKPVRLFSQREFNDKFAVRHYSEDRVLCRVVAEALADCDILCAHNGQFFDLPFLRGRLAIHKLQNLRTMPLLDPRTEAGGRNFQPFHARKRRDRLGRLPGGPRFCHLLGSAPPFRAVRGSGPGRLRRLRKVLLGDAASYARIHSPLQDGGNLQDSASQELSGSSPPGRGWFSGTMFQLRPAFRGSLGTVGTVGTVGIVHRVRHSSSVRRTSRPG